MNRRETASAAGASAGAASEISVSASLFTLFTLFFIYIEREIRIKVEAIHDLQRNMTKFHTRVEYGPRPRSAFVRRLGATLAQNESNKWLLWNA